MLSLFRSSLESFGEYAVRGTPEAMTQTEERQDQADAEHPATPCRVPRAFWLVIAVGWLALAGLAATGFRTDFAGDSRWAAVPESGTLQLSGTGTVKTIPCHYGYLSVSGERNTITVTGHCTSVSVSGHNNHVAVDSTDAVSTSGTGNVVTYHWGSPNTVNAGGANTVRQG